MADPAPSKDATAPSDKASAESGGSEAPARVDRAAFANTRQDVADKQADGQTVERFTNTKLNIALINDPKNGPRFTMTKRESGLAEKGAAGKAADGPETAAETTDEEAGATTPDRLETSQAEEATSSSVRPNTDVGEEKASEPARNQLDNAAEYRQPGSEASAPAALLTKPEPSGMPPAAQPPDKVPVDSSKTFVGHNGTYYDESWRWMDWRGTRQSWNWPAALSLGHWFAYRRLYMLAGLHLLWLAGLVAAAVNDVPVLGLAVLALLSVGLAGVYGNTLYFRAFRRAVDHVTQNGEGSYQQLRRQLAEAGGTSIAALSVMAVLSITGIAGALVATFFLRGGFFFNFWPF